MMQLNQDYKKNHSYLALILITLFGTFHWIFLLNYGGPNYDAQDWAFFHQWFDVLAQSLRQGKLPYHASFYQSEALLQSLGIPEPYIWGVRYFARPHTFFSPHQFLLAFLSLGQFITIHVLLVYWIAMAGLIFWIREFKLSIVPTVIITMFVSFNGFIVGHICSGNLVDLSYWLAPILFYLIYRWFIKDKESHYNNLKRATELGIFLSFCIYIGSIHVVFHFLLILGLCTLFSIRKSLYILWSGFIVLFSNFQFIYLNKNYGTYLLQDKLRPVFSGIGIPYGKTGIGLVEPKNRWEQIVNIIKHIWESLTFPFNFTYDGSWEVSVYFGKFGFLLIVSGSLYFIIKNYNKLVPFIIKNNKIIFPFIILFILCIRNAMAFFFNNFQKIIPISAIDQLPSRMFYYIVLSVCLFSTIQYENILNKFKDKRVIYSLFGLILLATFVELLIHSYGWRVIAFEDWSVSQESDQRIFEGKIYHFPEDIKYIQSVKVLSISCYLFFAGIIFYYYKRYFKNSTKA